MREYSGIYKGAERQVVLNQTAFERFLNQCYIMRSKGVIWPYMSMGVGVVALFISANILERFELSMPIFKATVICTCLTFVPLVTDLVLEGIFFRRPTRKEYTRVCDYIAQHPLCTYDDIMQSCIVPKTYYVADDMLLSLQRCFVIVVMIDVHHQTFYRLSTDEDWDDGAHS